MAPEVIAVSLPQKRFWRGLIPHVDDLRLRQLPYTNAKGMGVITVVGWGNGIIRKYSRFPIAHRIAKRLPRLPPLLSGSAGAVFPNEDKRSFRR